MRWRLKSPAPRCLLNGLFRRRSKKTSTLCVIGLCEGNSPVTGEFPAQKASNAENVSVWWRHHIINKYCLCQPAVHLQGLYSVSGKTSYRKISWSLEAARLNVMMLLSLWNLTGISVALLARCLPNLRTIGKFKLESRGFESSRNFAVRRPSA